MPALPSSVQEPLWVQVAALLPVRRVHHPLGCHRPRIPDRIVLGRLIRRAWASYRWDGRPRRRP